ncbi:MAG: hypothetical protein OYL97_08695 [Candidatus Poribacteria bacterium]|nr:hypothetical protein [Candidatus Poribacteria bacterium]
MPTAPQTPQEIAETALASTVLIVSGIQASRTTAAVHSSSMIKPSIFPIVAMSGRPDDSIDFSFSIYGSGKSGGDSGN